MLDEEAASQSSSRGDAASARLRNHAGNGRLNFARLMSAALIQQMKAKAISLHQAGELAAAKALYASILQIQPGNPDALHLFGLACHQQGDHATAARYIRQAVDRVPDQPVLRNNLGDALHKAGDLVGAAEQLREALALRPDYPGAHMNLGAVLAEAGDHDGAFVHSLEATRLDPERAEAWFNLGILELDHVAVADAIESLRTALAIRPAYPMAAQSLLYALNLLPGADPREVADEHRRVAEVLFGTVVPSTSWPEPSGKIRLGYVSGDFCAHAVNTFFEPILEHHDISRFEIHCYSDVDKPDAVTDRLRACAHHWREISGWSDSAVTEQIRSDRIDILFDLAGYTKHGRLGVFAAKPARCQISYLGYPNTTGLEAMDFRVVDQYTAPQDETVFGTEFLLRMRNGFACFHPPAHAPVVQAAPAASNGFVMFGCLHKLEKLNDSVVKTWARILDENPGSRLLIARDQLDEWHQRRLQKTFASFGIEAKRLKLIHLTDPTQSFLDLFARIDVLLDVFPWSGHTIACSALWMGVPVLTLRGTTLASRMVASVLDGLGLNDWIAEDVESYIRIAAELCRDQEGLSRIRAQLRERMERSALRDEVGFTREFETLLESAVQQTATR